jgi:uncharacterized membrane protein
MIIPPPKPWRTRNTISDSADQASPHSADATPNSATEIIQMRLAPKRSDAQPVSGITVASASRYPVATHWIVSSDAESLRDSVSRATLTIVVSRIDMTTPTTTTTATT